MPLWYFLDWPGREGGGARKGWQTTPCYLQYLRWKTLFCVANHLRIGNWKNKNMGRHVNQNQGSGTETTVMILSKKWRRWHDRLDQRQPAKSTQRWVPKVFPFKLSSIQVPEGTIKTWLFHFQQNKKYHQPSTIQHGRPPFLSKEQKKEVVESIEKLGARPNAAPIRARGVAAIARGIICRTTSQVCALHQIVCLLPFVFIRFYRSMEGQELLDLSGAWSFWINWGWRHVREPQPVLWQMVLSSLLPDHCFLNSRNYKRNTMFLRYFTFVCVISFHVV